MRIIIYESSSKGGNYKYAQALFDAYNKSAFTDVTLLLPRNSDAGNNEHIKGILLSDQTNPNAGIGKLQFIFRTFINPLILFFYILRKPKSLVLFNDFEQLSAPLWSSLFRIFLSKHRYAVFLHDPDRDQYPPSKAYAGFSMSSMLKMMQLVLYHEILPDKPYYQNRNAKTKYISVPHGIYNLPVADDSLRRELLQFRESDLLVGIIGNIRIEKNYSLAIRALQNIKQVKLVIAGSPSSSDVDIEQFKLEAEKYSVSDRILWYITYLSEPQMASVIESVDCVLLNYSSTFTSQSGIINMIAPYRKKIIVSNTRSSLTDVVRKFKLGIIIQPDSEEHLRSAIKSLINDEGDSGNWDEFIKYASWANQVKIIERIYADI